MRMHYLYASQEEYFTRRKPMDFHRDMREIRENESRRIIRIYFTHVCNFQRTENIKTNNTILKYIVIEVCPTHRQLVL